MLLKNRNDLQAYRNITIYPVTRYKSEMGYNCTVVNIATGARFFPFIKFSNLS